jgi:hypothetical protein
MNTKIILAIVTIAFAGSIVSVPSIGSVYAQNEREDHNEVNDNKAIIRQDIDCEKGPVFCQNIA